MSSPQCTGWTSFRLGTELPRLLVKLNFTNDGASTGYEVLISDSSQVWREALTNEQIIARARDIRCVIEPTDSENRQALFDLIRKSLSEAGQRTAEIKLDFSAAEDGQEFILRMSAPLAPSLPDLTWEVHLKLLPPSAISTYLLNPLLMHASDLHAQIDLLIKELIHKDHVIEKVCDRLETSGDTLTAIFPSKAGLRFNRKKSQRSQLGPYVAGLEEFDVATWPERWQKVVHESRVEGSTRQAEVLQNLPKVHQNEQAEEDGFWWKRVGKTSGFSERANFQHKDSSRAADPNESMNNGDKDVTPHRSLPSRSQAQGEEPTQHPARKLGALGGRPRAPATKHDSASDDRSRTASPVTEPEPESAVKPKRLGAIGGRKQAPETSTVADAEPSQPAISGLPSPPAKKAKIGTIGGRSRTAATDPTPESTTIDPPVAIKTSDPQSKIKSEKDDDESTRGRQISEAPSLRAKDETSQERADRKRQELKRELEEGVSTGAASKIVGVAKKKKRKF
jgi:hypothetical protein